MYRFKNKFLSEINPLIFSIQIYNQHKNMMIKVNNQENWIKRIKKFKIKDMVFLLYQKIYT